MGAEVKPSIRWMIRRDMPEVLDIERASFEFPWFEEDFIRCLRQRNSIGMVSEVREIVSGFMIYEFHKRRLHLLNFAVLPDARRRGIGTAMVDKLKSKLHTHRRTKITTDVRDSNVKAHLFFNRNGFRAVEILRDFYDDTDEDAYRFDYQERGRRQTNDGR
jgi:ribosomal-protein-alanine N-acetyltransferase